MEITMEKLVALAKASGFVNPGYGSYGGIWRTGGYRYAGEGR